METNVIEFNSQFRRRLVFHCHILYHMMAGMNRVFSTENQAHAIHCCLTKNGLQKLQKKSNELHFMFQNDFATNGNDGIDNVCKTRWSFLANITFWDIATKRITETETHIGRYMAETNG